MKELIRELTQAFGPSGSEAPVRETIDTLIRPLVKEVRTDALGNLIAFRPGTGSGKRVMLAAHMDEIGVIVTAIDDKGFLRFSNIGGVNALALIGTRVVFAGGAAGVIGSEPVDELKDLKLEKLFIDVGASSRAAAEKQVGIGDMAAFHGPFQDLGDRVVAKAMDDRIGCAILVQALRELQDSPHHLIAVFTVQEEVGLRGARTSAYGAEPDVGIALDVTRVGDTPKSRTMEVSMGKGAAIKVKDASLICHVGLRRHLVEVAKAHQIPYQLEVLERGGTDASSIQMARSGVPAGVISIPSRYIHTPSEMVDMADVRSCVQLVVKTLEGPIDL
ncbi:MAG TPA: aminopeptidase [Clostridiales bacterium UBA8153]|nr:aminopeptidase [Clostridiales bacterium UBA8153]